LFSRQHHPGFRLAGEKDTREIDIKHPLPLSKGHLFCRSRVRYACAVRRHRQRTELFLESRNRRGEILCLRHVASQGESATAGALDSFDRIIETAA
jgi:hypothetical protein